MHRTAGPTHRSCTTPRLIHGWWLIPYLLLAATHCSSATEPVLFQFQVNGAFEGTPVPTVEPRAGAVLITGMITFSCSPHSLTGAAEREGNVLTLRVSGIKVNGCTDATESVRHYRAELNGLDAGSYQVRVSHDLEAGTPNGTVIDTTVNVV